MTSHEILFNKQNWHYFFIWQKTASLWVAVDV